MASATTTKPSEKTTRPSSHKQSICAVVAVQASLMTTKFLPDERMDHYIYDTVTYLGVQVKVDGREPWLRVLADGDDDGVEHLLRRRYHLATITLLDAPHHPPQDDAAVARRRADVQDPGAESGGVHEPERVAEVPDVPQEIAVSRVAPGIAVVSGIEGEVGEADGLPGRVEPE